MKSDITCKIECKAPAIQSHLTNKLADVFYGKISLNKVGETTKV